MVDDPETAIAHDNTFLQPCEELQGMVATELRYIQYVETPEGPALLSRPVVEFAVPTTLMSQRQRR